MSNFISRVWTNERRADVAMLGLATLLNLIMMCLIMFQVMPSIGRTRQAAQNAHEAAERDYELIQLNNKMLKENADLMEKRQKLIMEFMDRMSKKIKE